ncbi:MAG: hypothetical protein JO290_11770 [Sphingomonadaceae bacterium]|nr:hypothetical protein [Sphingomonadaceae bacterium]
MRVFFAAALLAAVAVPVAAEEERTITSIAESPLSDVNLKKKHIPPVLVAAQAAPYATAGLGDCDKIAAAVKELDAVLGRDLDAMTSAQKRNEGRELAMDAGQDTINSLIPGRFIIRRLSGATEAQRKAVAAVYAGSVRRGFLKGLGEARKCAYPAAPRG